MNIQNIKLPEKTLLLAPMEAVTDASFRFICKELGADMLYTEFIASEGLVRNIENTIKKIDILEHEHPIGVQLYGHVIESMVEAAKIATDCKPDLIDINCGCPVKKIATRGAGAGLLQDIDKMVKMAGEIVKATHLPVTLKTRLGWDDNSKNIVEIAERLQDVGIQALTIHGRTRAQMYTGEADWTLIGEVKNNPRMKIPIIGNGDVTSPQKAKEMFDRYGVDGVMIGRGSIGRPWIFRDIRHYLTHGEHCEPLSISEKVDLALMQFDKSLEIKGQKVGIFEMRRHFSHYFQGLPNFKPIRMKLVTSMDIVEIKQIMQEIREQYGHIRWADSEKKIAKTESNESLNQQA